MSHLKLRRNQAIVKRRQSGWSFRRIASFYGIDVKTAYMVWKRWGSVDN